MSESKPVCDEAIREVLQSVFDFCRVRMLAERLPWGTSFDTAERKEHYEARGYQKACADIYDRLLADVEESSCGVVDVFREADVDDKSSLPDDHASIVVGGGVEYGINIDYLKDREQREWFCSVFGGILHRLHRRTEQRTREKFQNSLRELVGLKTKP